MKPFKSLHSFSRWLLRISLFLYLLVIYLSDLKSLEFSSVSFYFSVVYILFSALLLLGGVFSQGLTVVSGLVIFLLSLYQLIVSFSGMLTPAQAFYLIPFAIGLLFAASGNKS